MKMKAFAALILALCLTVCSACALADDGAKITVSGTGEIRVNADTAVVSVGVFAQDKDAIRAQSKANEIIAAIRQALTEAGISAEDINTGYINLYANYDYRGDTQEITGYNANSTLAVRVTDMAKVGSVIDTAFGAGANTLDGVSFSVTDAAEAREAALRAAVENARAKADILADAAGLNITGIEAIQDGNVSSYSANTMNYFAKGMDSGEAAMEMDAATVVQAAKILVSATVTITYTTGD